MVFGKPKVDPSILPVLAPHEQPDWLKQILSKGQVDAVSYRSSIKAAEAMVLAELKAENHAIEPEFLALLKADPQLHAGTFAAVYPADGRIFQNLQQIWQEVPAATFQKYRHLALAASVLRREVGVGPIAAPPGNFKHGMFEGWAKDAAAAGKTPANYLATLPSSAKGKGTVLTPNISAAIDSFKASHNKAPLNEIWADEKLRAELVASLVALKVDVKAVPGLLLDWQIAKKIRPAQRSAAPSVSAYIIALAKRLETPLDLNATVDKRGNALQWPMFPVAKAPWPILMGLGLTWPLDESQYIFEKLQGKHGENRLHLYGPYRHGGDEMTAASLTEIPWASTSWPQQTLTGGVCGTMATLAAGSYVSLGVPIFKTGQPGHGNLLTYRANSDGSFFARVEQSASAGPDGTYTEWPFGDVAHDRTRFAECHYGLALAMNTGLDSWLQTRLALTAFRSLAPEQQKTLGRKILAAATKENPFNAELWYSLADAAPDLSSRLQVLKQLLATITGEAAVAETVLKDVNADLADEKHSDGDRLNQEVQFRTLVRDVILQLHFSSPAKLTTAERQEVLAFIRANATQSSRQLTALTLRYELSLQDSAKLLRQLHDDCQAVLAPGKSAKRAAIQREKAAAVTIAQLSSILTPQLLEEALTRELAGFTQENALVTAKNGPKLRPIAAALIEALSQYYNENNRKKDARALQQKTAAWLK